jgi:methionine aminotransferase
MAPSAESTDKVQLLSKLPQVGTTIFTVMSQMALDHDAINLSQGFPDFNCPQDLRDLVSDAMNKGQNQYAPMIGIPSLRDQIARKSATLYGKSVDMNAEVTVTSGATEAIFVAIQAVVNPGNEVIIFDPAFDCYEPAITLAGGRAVHIPLNAPVFSIDWDRVEQAINDNTRMIIVNSPHNPTGAIISRRDLETLHQLTANTNIVLLSDEVYEHMVFDGDAHHSLLTHEALANRSFVVSSFGKTYHATGWKVAYCVAPAYLSDEFRKVHQYVTFCTNTPIQHALAIFMETHSNHYRELAAFYQAKRDLFIDLLSDSNFKLTPTRGTYFQMADYSQISTMKDTDFSVFLTQQVGVAAIPITVFCEKPQGTHMIRFCFAKDDETLKLAASKLRNL